MWLNEKGERGQGGSETWRWVNRRWVEDWIWGVSASDLQNLVWDEKGVQLIHNQELSAESWLILTHAPSSCILPLILPGFQQNSKPGGLIALSLRVPHKILPYHPEFQTQKSVGSSGVIPGLAQRSVCICAAWPRACLCLGRSYIPLPEGADRQQCMWAHLSSPPRIESLC